MQKESCEIFHIEHAAGYFFGCRLCRKTLASGTWAIGLKIDGTSRYLVGHNPPIICCGEKKTIPLVFDSEGDLLPVSEQLKETLNREGATTSLALIGFSIVESNATH